MFSKNTKLRSKTAIPPDVFLPTRQRVMAIIHLCIAFTLICWYLSQPFMGKHFAVKSKMSLLERVFSVGNGKFFLELPRQEKAPLLHSYEALQKELNLPFYDKVKSSVRLLAVELPPFEQAWLLFSLIIPIMLLKRVEGARLAAWLLPVLVLFYSFDNQINGKKAVMSEEDKLFPAEDIILQKYLQEPLSKSIFEQQEQLIKGFKIYLIRAYVSEEPSKDPIAFEKQLERGQFLFSLARAKAMSPLIQQIQAIRLSWIMLALYLAWNVFFAWTFLEKREAKAPAWIN